MYFRYLGRELRRRARSASVVAIGLALAVGLVITVTAAASGVNAAQGQVLSSLYGVGTDLTVTEAPAAGSGGSFSFNANPSSRAEAGQAFSQDRLSSSPGLTTIATSKVTSIANLKGVAGAAGALVLNSIHVSGSFGNFFGGGSSSSSAATPTPTPTPTPSASASPSASPSPGAFGVTTFSVDGIDPSTPGVGLLSGANITSGASAVSQWFSEVQQGSAADQLLALVSSSYAKQNSLKANSTLTIDGSTFTVVGVVTVTETDGADIYIPLSEAQTLSGDTGDVNTVYVTATDSAAISSVQAEIQKLLPSATVTTAADLASNVSGSLSTASTLANTLGVWLSALVLLAAFVLAVLLTIASVTRRVREFGTLKAIGWRSRRIVGQVLGESAVLGIIGGAVGIGLGVLGAFLVTRLAPPLSATVGATGLGGSATASTGGGGFPGGGEGGFFGGASPGAFASSRPDFARTFAPTSHSVPVHLTAPLSLEVLLVAVGLAIVGGVIAGILGGWRAARLHPAEALRRVE
ncbi:MAG: ABC transporter permease [Candidatus Dormibacteria bacterium]